jgi:hypothetical protein
MNESNYSYPNNLGIPKNEIMSTYKYYIQRSNIKGDVFGVGVRGDQNIIGKNIDKEK